VEEGLERLAESLDVRDLTVAHDARVERRGGGVLDGHLAVDETRAAARYPGSMSSQSHYVVFVTLP